MAQSVTGGQTVTGNTTTGTRLICMSDGCGGYSMWWVTIDEGAGVDGNGQIHEAREVNKHVCTDCRDVLITDYGWRLKRW